MILKMYKFNYMKAKLNQQKVREKAAELGLAARSMVLELSRLDQSPEAVEAANKIQHAINMVISGGEDCHKKAA